MRTTACSVNRRSINSDRITGQNFKCLLDPGVALRLDFIALFDANALIEDFGLQTAADEIRVRRDHSAKLRLDLSLIQVLAELIQQLRRHFEVRVNFVLAQVFGGERRE